MRSTLADTHISATELPVSALGSWVNDQPLTVITDFPPDKNSLSKSARFSRRNATLFCKHDAQTPLSDTGESYRVHILDIFTATCGYDQFRFYFGGFRFSYVNQGICASSGV